MEYKKLATICITVVSIAFLGSMVLLILNGKDTAELTRLLQMVLSFGGALAGTGAFVFSQKAAKQTNGGLEKRIENSVHTVLDEREGNDGRQTVQRARVNRDRSSGDNHRKSSD